MTRFKFNRRRPLAATLGVLVAMAASEIVVPVAHAQEANEAPALFPQGTQMVSAEGRYVIGIEDGEELPNAALAYDYFFVDNLSLGLEVAGYGFFQDNDDTAGLGLHARFRHHVITSDNASLFLNVGFGPFYGDDPVPAGGTRFNFVSRAGVGGMFRLDETCVLTTGLQYWHISNGNLVEGDNPAINGVQAFVGIGWTF